MIRGLHPATVRSLRRNAYDTRVRSQRSTVQDVTEARQRARFPIGCANAQELRQPIEGDEINCIFLLPMWKTVFGMPDFGIGVEIPERLHVAVK